MGKQQDEPHDELRQHIGHHVLQGDAQRALPQLARNGHERGLAALQDLGAHHAGEARPMCHRHADGDAPEPLAERKRYEDEQHDVRDAHHEVDEPGDRDIGLLAAERRRRAQHERDDRGRACGQKAHEHARGQARQRAQEHVAPHPVGAEGVRQAGARGSSAAKSVAVAASAARKPAATTAASAATASTKAASVSFDWSPDRAAARSRGAPGAAATLKPAASQVSFPLRMSLRPLAHARIHHAVQHVGYEVAAEHERRRQHARCPRAAPRRRRGPP